VPGLLDWERSLTRRAELIFTAHHRPFRTKTTAHPNVHEIPDGFDIGFFARARESGAIPGGQVGMPMPRIGYLGPIDEHVDTGLIAGLA
jgi:UDP-galactopyranose mutase